MDYENIKIKTTPKDFFVFIGAMAALYWSAVSFINLLFEIINASFPDALSFSYDNFSSGMRWSIASLIIIFPIYIFLSWFINKDLVVNFLKKNLGIRKWLTYLTLFIAGVTIITDLIILINTFLGGEITTRFALKVLAVLIVAGTVFAYYLYDLKRDVGQKSGKVKLLVYVVSFAVLASIVGGFFIIGSPFSLRMKRFDERRVNDLQNIQYQIVNFYQRKGGLPNNLGELKDPITGFNIPLDPERATSYDYEKVSELSFKLCADFSLESDAQIDLKNMTRSIPVFLGDSYLNENWQHSSGRQCFDRKIDKDLYPILKNPKI
ncbi:hypothetical protein COT82_01830 [Candidatus Campbellbacteria bacterium CG10_big_fil_rev_8_21_14_0_10_35_52]|uniref:DUF5671 domain-containing protein n=1 Tax=Candidatus Campbellbacteria bacterium CG10_big_fil_rev_8_21_14_0_10_35_52 TaxID=1974527 RepID=A0A2M6WV68_9BACT|nr:MAG: hypothetical protein COT82_01830 [Candidatus Campbellbacteria bacterium CG10_big_fil_rev_8_21_14_0_10_35_52]